MVKKGGLVPPLPRWLSSFKKIIKPHARHLFFLLSSFGLYFFLLFKNVFIFTDEGFYVNHVHVWSDWSLHIAMANIFALKDPGDWFAYHPFFAGGKFTYAFLTNLVSGLLMRAGVPLAPAFIVPSITYVLLLIIGLYFVYYLVLKSRGAAALGVSLFFLSAGPGFFRFFKDLAQDPSWQRFLFPTQDFSRLEEYQMYAGNFVNGMLLPQRAFLLGMTIAVWVLVGFLVVLRKPANSRYNRVILFLTGTLAGILPIAHMHSLIVLVITTGLISFVNFKRWRELVWFVAPAALISSFFFFNFVYGGIENPEFMIIHLGWTAEQNLVAWLIMWWRIWGVALVTGIAGLWFLRKEGNVSMPFFVGLWFVFALANIVIFQPIWWDNTKLFLWVYIGIAGSSALLLVKLWQNTLPYKLLSLALFLMLSLTGAIELGRLQQLENNKVFFATYQEINLGKKIREQTDSRAVFLTNTAHNHPVMLWGVRSISMGYTAWALNFGFDYQPREQAIRTIYQGGAETNDLLKELKIDYIVIGPGEQSSMNANQAYFDKHFPIFMKDGAYTIYTVPKTP